MFAAKVSTMSRILVLIIIVILIGVSFEFALWSLDQTIEFLGVFIETTPGKFIPIARNAAAGVLVQLYPTAAFLIAGTLLGGWKTLEGRIIIFTGVAINFLDLYTNIGAVTMTPNIGADNLSPATQRLIEPAKYISSFVVTQMEELMSFLVAIGFHLLGLILQDMGIKSPDWFLAAERIGFAATYGVTKPIHSPGNQPPKPKKSKKAPRQPVRA